MVKTRSLYLNWSRNGTGSWKTNGRTSSVQFITQYNKTFL